MGSLMPSKGTPKGKGKKNGVKQGRKRNSRLDLAAEWMKQHPGRTLQEGLATAGFSQADAQSKNYRDQLSRRLRNDRRAQEGDVLENDMFVKEVKGMWEVKKLEFLNDILGAGSLSDVQANALGQFICEDIKGSLRNLVMFPPSKMQQQSLQPSAAAGVIPSPPPETVLKSEREIAGVLGTIRKDVRVENPSSHTPTAAASSTRLPQSSLIRKRARSIDYTIPTVGGVEQEWTALGSLQAPCVWDNHHRHTHQFGSCTLAHTAKKHCPPGAEPHVDFIIQNGDKTIIECYGNVKGKTDNLYSALCDCHGTIQNCDGHNFDLLPELLDPTDVDMSEFFDFDETVETYVNSKGGEKMKEGGGEVYKPEEGKKVE